MLSFDTREIAWKGAALSPVIREVQESIAVPSDHCENMLMSSPEPTVGGVRMLLTWKEKAAEMLWVRPVTVSWAVWEL